LHGSKGTVFIIAIVTPIIISFIISLLFGTLISQKPKLGIVDGGTSRIVTLITESASITGKEYDSAPKLKKAVAAGAVDVGVVLPKGFDRFVISGEKAEVTTYVWGESLIKNRAMVGAVMAKQIRAMAGQKPPVEIVSAALGAGEGMTWEERLLPLMVLIAIFMGGMMVPAVSLVDEKQKQTLKALVITPASGDIYLAKGAVGAILSLFMGVLILLLNHALGTQPVLLLLVLSLGAILAATVGVLLGTLVKDVNSLFLPKRWSRLK
jgi:ABC-2 type transport system permease protein